MSEVRGFIEHLATMHLSDLAKHCQSDVLAIYGPMNYQLPGIVRDEIEHLSKQETFNGHLTIMLDTGGGLVSCHELNVGYRRSSLMRASFAVNCQLTVASN